MTITNITQFTTLKFCFINAIFQSSR